MSKFYNDVLFTPHQPIEQEMLSRMVLNDSFVNQIAVETKLRNVNPDSGRFRGSPKSFLINDIVTFSFTKEYTPGGDLVKSGGYRNQFTKTFEFPENTYGKYFDNRYQPAVMLGLAWHSGLPQRIVMDNINPGLVKFTIYVLKNIDLHPNQDEFWVEIFAVGIRGDWWEKSESIAATQFEEI